MSDYISAYTGAQMDDAFSKRHSQNTDTALATGTSNEVTASALRGIVDNMYGGESLQFLNGVAFPIRSVSGNTSLSDSDYTLIVDCSLGDIEVSLPTALNRAGRVYNIKKIDSTAYVVKVLTIGSDSIDGDTQKQINYKNTSLTLQSNGASAWYVI
jgi:hypothetical protein